MPTLRGGCGEHGFLQTVSLYAALGTPYTDSPEGCVPAGTGPPQACQSPDSAKVQSQPGQLFRGLGPL